MHVQNVLNLCMVVEFNHKVTDIITKLAQFPVNCSVTNITHSFLKVAKPEVLNLNGLAAEQFL